MLCVSSWFETIKTIILLMQKIYQCLLSHDMQTHSLPPMIWPFRVVLSFSFFQPELLPYREARHSLTSALTTKPCSNCLVNCSWKWLQIHGTQIQQGVSCTCSSLLQFGIACAIPNIFPEQSEPVTDWTPGAVLTNVPRVLSESS